MIDGGSRSVRSIRHPTTGHTPQNDGCTKCLREGQPLGQPCRCLWRGLLQTTKTTPLRRTTLQFSQIRFTLARTFITTYTLNLTMGQSASVYAECARAPIGPTKVFLSRPVWGGTQLPLSLHTSRVLYATACLSPRIVPSRVCSSPGRGPQSERTGPTRSSRSCARSGHWADRRSSPASNGPSAPAPSSCPC